jgi:hypothetical protein
MTITDVSTARLVFRVTASLTCVSTVEFTISLSSDASDTTAYLFPLRDAGVGQPATAPVAPGGSGGNSRALGAPGGTSSPQNFTLAVPAAGWTGTRVFNVEVTDAALSPGALHFGVVAATGCTAFQVPVSTSIPLLYDPSGPEYVIDTIQRVLTVVATHELMAAEWPWIADPQSGVVFVSGQFYINGTLDGPSLDVTHLTSVVRSPTTPISDGSTVGFTLTATNAASIATVFNATALVDTSPPVCGVMGTLGAWAEVGIIQLDANNSSNTTVTAQVECEDPHSGISGVVFSVGYVKCRLGPACVCADW